MAIVVMDTATEVLAVGVGRQLEAAAQGTERGAGSSTVDYACSAVVPRSHSRWLQPALAQGLKICQLQPTDIAVIGVGVGPGSYTGVRLGVSTAKAMAMALGAEIARIPTLLALAQAATADPVDDVMVMPLLNARRQRAFGAVYARRSGRWETITPVRVQETETWLRALADAQVDARADMLVPHVVHDFVALQAPTLPPDVRAHRLRDIGAQLPGAMIHLIANGDVGLVAGDDIHAVVPEYALLVEAESRLAEGGGPTVDAD